MCSFPDLTNSFWLFGCWRPFILIDTFCLDCCWKWHYRSDAVSGTHSYQCKFWTTLWFSCKFWFFHDFCMKSLSLMNKNECFDWQLFITQQDFFKKLMDTFHICEDLENLDGLHMIYKIVRGISQYSFLVLFTTTANYYFMFLIVIFFLHKMQSSWIAHRSLRKFLEMN